MTCAYPTPKKGTRVAGPRNVHSGYVFIAIRRRELRGYGTGMNPRGTGIEGRSISCASIHEGDLYGREQRYAHKRVGAQARERASART